MDESTVSAESLFQRISTNVKVILGDDSSAYENDYVLETITLIEQCALSVDREYLISKNEEFDDIPTPTLKVTLTILTMCTTCSANSVVFCSTFS